MDTLMEELEQAAKGIKTEAEAPNPAKKPTTKSWMKAVISGGLLLLVAAGTGAWMHFRDRVSTDDAQVDAHIASIAPKISGNIAEILVNDNEVVKAGQPLVKIDPRDYQARVAQAKAALAAAESTASGARANVPMTNLTTASGTSAAEAQLAAASAEYGRSKTDFDRASSSEIAYARADVEAKRATADRAIADRARMEPLAAQDEISRQQFDAYIAAARVAQSDVTAAEQKLANVEKQALSSRSAMDAAQARVLGAQAGVQQAQANRKQVDISAAQAGTASAAILQARANLEAAELELSYTTITAPIDGVVTKKMVQLGQIIQPGQSMMTVVPMQDVWVTANFKETQLANVRPGQKVDVRVDMYGRSFSGHVDSIANATGTKLSLLPPENATGNYVKVVQRIPVKVVLNDIPAGIAFRPGMNVDATIYTR